MIQLQRIFALVIVFAGVAPAVEPERPSAGALGSTPWYDASSDSVIPVDVKPNVDDSVHRNSRWLPKAKRVVAPPTNSGSSSTGLFGSGWTLGNIFAISVLSALLVSIVAALVYAFSKAEVELSANTLARTRFNGAPDEQTIERMKHLPAELRHVDGNLREEAWQLFQAEQFDLAIVMLFGHQLLLLDSATLLRLTRGKTNGRYVRETRMSAAAAGELLRQTVSAFERSFFGRHTLLREEFEQLWQDNQRLESIVQNRQGVAA